MMAKQSIRDKLKALNESNYNIMINQGCPGKSHLQSMLLYVLGCVTTVYCSISVYRSRFHPDYLPGSLDTFLSLVAAKSSAPRDESLAAKLRLFSTVIPCKTKDKKDGADLVKAVKLKIKIAKRLWSNRETRTLLSEGELAEQFSNALLGNLIGHQPELLKPLAKTTIKVIFREPAKEMLTSTYKLLYRVYRRVSPESLLFVRLHSSEFLSSLARLLYSPDLYERAAICQLFSETITYRIDQLERLSESGREDLRRYVGNMIVIMQMLIPDINSRVTQIALRPLVQIFHVLQESIKASSSTEFEEPFKQILIRAVVPLFDSLGYHKFSPGFEALLEFQLEEAQGSPGSYWRDISSGLVRYTFRRCSSYSGDNDLARFEFLLWSYSRGQIHPSVHAALLKKLICQARNRSMERVKIKVLQNLLRPQFMQVFSTDCLYKEVGGGVLEMADGVGAGLQQQLGCRIEQHTGQHEGEGQ